MAEVPLFIMAMNRPVRSRMQGGEGRAGLFNAEITE